MGVFDKIRDQFLGVDKPLQSEHDQTHGERELVAHIKRKVDEAKNTSSRTAQEGIWMTNAAYLLGYAGYYYNTTTRVFQNNDRILRGGNPRSRSRVNKILPYCQNRLARLTKAPPKWDCRPESNSTDDKDASRLSVQVIQNVWDKQKINLKRLQLVMMTQQFGYAFAHVCWDPNLGEWMVNPETGEGDYQGDIRVDICSPFEIFTDPLAKSMDEVTWLVRAKVRKLDYFKDQYPERGHLVKEEDTWLLGSQFEMKINDLSSGGGSSGDSRAQMKNAAIELAYYEKPSRKHPQGRMVVVANGILLEDKDLPVGKIPYVKFDDVMVGGRFAAEAIITHLRPIQDRYNKLLNKRDAYVDKVLAGKYKAARGHGLSAEALDNESGEVLEYDPVPGAENGPEALQIPAIPQYAYNEEESLDNQMDFVSGINDVSRGEMPSAGMPALGMQILEEQDQTRLGVVTLQQELAWSEVGQLILAYVDEYYQMPRLLKVAGEGLEYTVKQFVGADLKGNLDVYVIPGSTDPGSKVLKRQDILTAYREGLLGDPTDPKVREKVLKILEYGDLGEVWQDQALDMAQIKEQIEIITQGGIPDQSELDNHALHIQEKNRFRKTEKFKALSPTAQQVLIADIEFHVDALVQLMAPELGQQQEMAEEMMNATDQVPEDPGIPVEAPMQGVG